MLCDDEGRDWSYEAASQGKPNIASKTTKSWEEARKDIHTGFRRIMALMISCFQTSCP